METKKIILFSEKFLYALLLDSISEACATMTDGELNSWDRTSYASALRELGMAGYVDIQSENADSIVATKNQLGCTLLNCLYQEKEEQKPKQ